MILVQIFFPAVDKHKGDQLAWTRDAHKKFKSESIL